jgi:hypothetical protein
VGEETFGYNELQEQSTTMMENVTEDSVLCSTTHLQEKEPEVQEVQESVIMDATTPDVNSEPIYAVIDHSQRETSPALQLEETSTEQSMSTDRKSSDSSAVGTSTLPPEKEPVLKEVIMKQQGDVSREVNIIQEKLIHELKATTPKKDPKKKDNKVGKIGKIGKIAEPKETTSTASSSATQNELAYAFSFLKSTEAEAEHETPAGASVNGYDVSATNNVGILGTSEKKPVEEPDSGSDGYGSDEEGNDGVKANKMIQELEKTKEVQQVNNNNNKTNDVGESQKIRNYQPKFLVELNRVFKENRDKAEVEEKVELRKTTNFNGHGNFNSSRYNEHEQPSFDATPSMEHRYANFSVNDILRQSYLPLTRSDLNTSTLPSFGDEHQQHQQQPTTTTATDVFQDEVRKPSKLSSLNIQNQYQYENSERNRKRSSEHDEVPKIDETKSFGKPVMSRKTDLAPTSWDAKKRQSYTNLNTISLEETTEEIKHSILNPKLRKTKNSELILGIRPNSEDEHSGTEDFIKATSIAEYLSSDQQEYIDDAVQLPNIKSKIHLF